MKKLFVVSMLFMGWQLAFGQIVTRHNGANLDIDLQSIVLLPPYVPPLPLPLQPAWSMFIAADDGWYQYGTLPNQTTQSILLNGKNNDSSIGIGVLALSIYTPNYHPPKRLIYTDPSHTLGADDINFPANDFPAGVPNLNSVKLTLPFSHVIAYDTIPIIATFSRKNATNSETIFVTPSGIGENYLGEGVSILNVRHRPDEQISLVFGVGELHKRLFLWYRVEDIEENRFEVLASNEQEKAIAAQILSAENKPFYKSGSKLNGTSDNGAGRGAVINNEYGTNSDVAYIRPGKGRDPNDLVFSPEEVEPGVATKIKATINFENNGTADVSKITMSHQFSGKFDPLTSNPLYDRTKYTHNPITLRLDSLTCNRSGGIIGNCLMGLNMPALRDINPDSLGAARGYFSFDFYTLPTVKSGDEISGFAKIKMYDQNGIVDALDTKYAYVRVKKNCRKKLGFFYGLKVFYNNTPLNRTFDLARQKDFGVALTGRFAISKMNTPWSELQNQPVLRVKDLPSVWYQIELGYSRTVGVSGKEHGNIDLTPFELRFKVPLKKIVIYPSIGFTSSFTYLQSKGLGFTDFAKKHLSTTLFASIDFGNVLGQTGISYGIGAKYRNLNLDGTKYKFIQPFAFVHYTLGRIKCKK